MKLRILVGLLVALFAFSPGSAAAARHRVRAVGAKKVLAKRHYILGLNAYKAGDYDSAIKELKLAYQISHMPALLLNLGATYRKSGDYDKALSSYQAYLTAMPAARNRPLVEKIVSEVEQERTAAAAGQGGDAVAQAPAEAPPAATPPLPKQAAKTTTTADGLELPPDTATSAEAALGGSPTAKPASPPPAAAAKSKPAVAAAAPSKPAPTSTAPAAAAQNDAVEPAPATNPPLPANTLTLDDEEAPLDGVLGKHRQDRPRKLGKGFWAGTVFAVAGVAAIGVSVWALNRAQQYSDILSQDSANGVPFNDPKADPYDDYTIQERGKRVNTLGTALAISGIVAVVGGSTLMAIDQLVWNKREPERRRRGATALLTPAIGTSSVGLSLSGKF